MTQVIKTKVRQKDVVKSNKDDKKNKLAYLKYQLFHNFQKVIE